MKELPKGPLAGLRVVEFAGIGPGPFCAMLLADLGADVIRLDRPGGNRAGIERDPSLDLLNRSRRSVAVDLKTPSGVALALDLIAKADASIEGYRPGVMERLGLGPDVCLGRNPKLVYGRMTGWGQDGPYAAMAGHDINYLALSGALYAMGDKDRPPAPPLNLVADFGGGALYLAFGLLAAIHAAAATGQGQVVDAAMVDGCISMTTMFHGFAAMGLWQGERASNHLDGGAPHYRVYATADGGFVAVGAIEEPFYRALLQGLGLDPADVPDRTDKANWPALHALFEATFRSKTRDAWTAIFDGGDACVTPVLSFDEAPTHPHNSGRAAFVEAFGARQPAPAPRFSETPGDIQRPPPAPGADTRDALADWGIDAARIVALVEAGALGDG